MEHPTVPLAPVPGGYPAAPPSFWPGLVIVAALVGGCICCTRFSPEESGPHPLDGPDLPPPRRWFTAPPPGPSPERPDPPALMPEA